MRPKRWPVSDHRLTLLVPDGLMLVFFLALPADFHAERKDGVLQERERFFQWLLVIALNGCDHPLDLGPHMPNSNMVRITNRHKTLNSSTLADSRY